MKRFSFRKTEVEQGKKVSFLAAIPLGPARRPPPPLGPPLPRLSLSHLSMKITEQSPAEGIVVLSHWHASLKGNVHKHMGNPIDLSNPSPALGGAWAAI